MKSSFKLFSVRGIDIRMHLTFPLVLAWAAFQFSTISWNPTAGALFGVITISLLFVIVTLHELGHSFAALHFGVPVRRIVLLPIGGVAELENMPEKPAQELVIAIAGPAVNVAIGILMWLLTHLFDIPLAGPSRILSNLTAVTFDAVFGYLFFYNVIIAVFNMLPAFPMDGGRVLRALLAMGFGRRRGTSIAVFLGQGLAVLLGIWGFMGGGFFTVFIAFFIFMGAGREGELVKAPVLQEPAVTGQ